VPVRRAEQQHAQQHQQIERRPTREICLIQVSDPLLVFLWQT